MKKKIHRSSKNKGKPCIKVHKTHKEKKRKMKKIKSVKFYKNLFFEKILKNKGS